MRIRPLAATLVCLALAPCAHAPAPLGLSIIARPPGPTLALEPVPSAPARARAALAALPVDVEARLVPGAAPEVRPGPEEPTRTPFDLGVRLPARPVALPDVAPGTSAAFRLDGGRRGWVAHLEGQRLPSPVYANGKVMVGGGFASHTFYGLDAQSGRFAWAAEASDGGPSAGLAVDDKVLFNTESCTLFCIDPKTGRVLWRRWLGDPVMGQPAAANGVVYSGHIVDGARGYALSALRLSDGQPIWRRPLDSDVLSAPVISGAGRDASVYLTTMSGAVYRFRARDGAKLWHAPAEATSAPWVEGGLVFVSRRRPGGHEQQVTLDAADGLLVAAGRETRAPYATERPDAHGVRAGWSYEGSRPTLANGRAYYAIGDELRARDLRTGSEVWRRRAPRGGAERGMTPPAVVGGTLVVGTTAGEIFGIDVDTGMTTFAVGIGEPIATQPIVAKGWVYCTTASGRLVGLELADPGLDGWHMWGGSAAHTGPLPASFDASHARRDPTEGILRATADGSTIVVAPQHTSIDARVSGFVARIEVDQLFVNPTGHALDAAYLLPLPSESAVDALEMVVGGREIHAEIRRRADARATFEAARASGRTASLLEEERPNLFQQTVANIPPHGEVRVRVRLVAVLRFANGSYELAIPLRAAPRYRSGGGPPEPVPATRPGDALDVRVEIDAGAPIASATSSSHEVRTERPEPDRRTLTLERREELPNRDFVVRYSALGAATRAAFLATRTRGRGTFALMLHPPERAPPSAIAPRELVVLVDHSSSMAGRASQMAQTLAMAAIESLSPGDSLRLVAFADRARSMAPGAVRAGAAAIENARRFLGEAAPQGGTELGSAVAAAFRAPADPARIRTVLLVTDGNVGADDEVLSLVARSMGQTRLHAIGLGASPNRWLLERAAEIGRGSCAVVGLTEDASRAGRDLAARLARPLVTDLQIDWGGLPVRDVYPRILPDLNAGEPLIVVGRTDGPGGGTVRLRGRTGGRPWSIEHPVELPDRSDRHEALGAAWARRRVHEIETAMLLRPSDSLREQIAEIGLENGIVTGETSLVAVAPEAGDVRRRAAPAAASRWPFEAQFWRDELGAYRGGPAPGVPADAGDASRYARARIWYQAPAASAPGGWTFDEIVDGDLARPDGEMATTADRELSIGSRAELAWDGPIVNAQIASPPAAPRWDARIQATFASAAQGIAAAYREALERDRTLRGRLVVEVTIRRDGSVAALRRLRAIGDAVLEAAVLEIVRTLSFGPGAAQTVEYPIDFAPAPRGRT
ncbi:MAG: TonB family protein [Deltaproteobacteria bacterium]|nr:TonB family protein [Deltaproteobacteria bacterium]